MDKPWVFVMEHRRCHEVELSITLIAPVSWKEEVYYLRNTDVRYTMYTRYNCNLHYIIANQIITKNLIFNVGRRRECEFFVTATTN